MKNKFVVILIVFSILTPILFNQNSNILYDLKDGDSIEIENSTNFLQPKFALADEKVVDNIIPNSGFEESDAYNHPDILDVGEPGMTYQNKTYDLDAYSGVYSAIVQGQGSVTDYAYSPLYQQVDESPNSFVNQSFILDLEYKILNTPDPSLSSRVQILVSFFDSGVYRNLYYVLSYYSGLSNSTNNIYIDLNSTWNVWHHLNRNVTADFESTFGYIGPAARITYFYLYVISVNRASAPTEALFDDVYLTSASSGNLIVNSDFESTDSDWWGQTNSMGQVSLTDDHFSGSKAINITMANQFTDKTSDYQYSSIRYYLGYPEGYFATQPNEVVLSFDWKYLDNVAGGYGQRAYIEVQMRDFSGYKYLRIMVGQGEDCVSTSTLVVKA